MKINKERRTVYSIYTKKKLAKGSTVFLGHMEGLIVMHCFSNFFFIWAGKKLKV